jgi:hypothetical protein
MQTPTARIVATANAIVEVTDADGRRLALRRLTALDKLRLFKAAGPQLAHNAPWLGMAMLAYSVAAIDDVPVPAPVTEAQIELSSSGSATSGSQPPQLQWHPIRNSRPRQWPPRETEPAPRSGGLFVSLPERGAIRRRV